MTVKMHSLENKLDEIQKNLVTKESIEVRSLSRKGDEVSNTQSLENHSAHDVLKNVNKSTDEKSTKSLRKLKEKKQKSLFI